MKNRPSWFVGLAGVAVLATSVLTVGCAVHGKVKTSASANESQASTDSDIDGAFSGAPPASTGTVASRPAPAPEPSSTAVAAAAPSPPPADACPLSCYEASGATRMLLTAEETAQVRTALEPALSRMRTCESADAWKRHGSPMMHLRLDSNGKLSEFDVDPSRGDTGCFDSAASSSNISVTLPGRTTVRCAERCEHESARRSSAQGKPKSAGKGKKPAHVTQ
ncbi:hypothetical protein AKJ09_11343 [Labilithrix luteola]|uniref:Uncharacterized protein n=1 Tax=Labilithrix luteola TaxID=1391654 RepID=A0A0K1QGW6_9BACT|nr:hypothetical protein [Labilithrix luteola]AKV04680.1 hypothetical protein AKJ09_11343 [Labilithrix luteola]